ncbi:UDP-N-acetylmuramate dehydrogenase [uncultured Acetobacteroides sp.]|uniref:UDP-N-acetylmuramate dehydrogenase n=1 Tax=uncultured Acetobacteroides sp. TaxID=1760811 RepID=UPI0029F49ABA|nr:UDP-N-acetylmuramate dehydrogenase [uncultured Acetobacteroides sp.]
MNVLENFSLKEITTFGIDANAKNFVQPANDDEVVGFLKSNKTQPIFVLGGGSNIIFTSDFEGVVLQPTGKSVEVLSEDCDSATLRVGAGMEWDDLVKLTVGKGLGGLENLSLIPGHVGACPVQNIGAYGVEVKDTIVAVEGFYLDSAERFCFDNGYCQFGYRDSIFKHELRGKVAITHVTFLLSKSPVLKTHYGNIEEELKNYSERTVQTVRDAVISIRERKLPDPKVIGNCGSFFKNPTISKDEFDAVKAQYSNVPNYPAADGKIKVPAAWLIETCGYKGIKKGHVGVHGQQALVLINLGNATGKEVIALADEIIAGVSDKFGIVLEKEVNIL